MSVGRASCPLLPQGSSVDTSAPFFELLACICAWPAMAWSLPVCTCPEGPGLTVTCPGIHGIRRIRDRSPDPPDPPDPPNRSYQSSQYRDSESSQSYRPPGMLGPLPEVTLTVALTGGGTANWQDKPAPSQPGSGSESGYSTGQQPEVAAAPRLPAESVPSPPTGGASSVGFVN